MAHPEVLDQRLPSWGGSGQWWPLRGTRHTTDLQGPLEGAVSSLGPLGCGHGSGDSSPIPLSHWQLALPPRPRGSSPLQNSWSRLWSWQPGWHWPCHGAATAGESLPMCPMSPFPRYHRSQDPWASSQDSAVCSPCRSQRMAGTGTGRMGPAHRQKPEATGDLPSQRRATGPAPHPPQARPPVPLPTRPCCFFPHPCGHPGRFPASLHPAMH